MPRNLTLAGLSLMFASFGCGPSSPPAANVEPVTTPPSASAQAETSAAVPSAATSASVGPAASGGPAASASVPPPAKPAEPSPLITVDLTDKGAPPEKPQPLFAPLFQKGRSWKVQGVQKIAGDENGVPVSRSTKFKAQCKVDSVDSFRWGMLSEVTCNDLPEASTPSLLKGNWLLTSKGLFHLSGLPGGTRFDLMPSSLVFEPNPKPAHTEDKDPEMEGFVTVVTIEAKGDGFCHSTSQAAGDEGWVKVCLSPKTGFVSGDYG
jgi:hypothetical protein